MYGHLTVSESCIESLDWGDGDNEEEQVFARWKMSVMTAIESIVVVATSTHLGVFSFSSSGFCKQCLHRVRLPHVGVSQMDEKKEIR